MSPRLDEEAKDDTDEVPEVQKTPKAKEVQPNLSQESPDSFPLLADTAEYTSDATLPNTQPSNSPGIPLKSLPDLITGHVDGVEGQNGEPNDEANEVDEEMSPLEEKKV